MHKKGSKYQSRLLAELASLRKGRGIAPTKMHDKIVLREAMARAIGVDGNGITNSQIHNQLLIEIAKLPHTTPFTALRFALSLADEVKGEETLLQRRRTLARMLGKHPDTVIRYENQALDALVLRLKELGEEAGYASEPQGSPADYRTLERLGVYRDVMRDTAVLSLSGLLPVADKASDLVHYLERTQRPYLDMTAEIRILPSNRGEDWYRLDVKYIFSGVRDTFRLVIVMNVEDGERLLAQGLVDDFHKINDQIDPRQEMRTILNSSRFVAHNHARNSQKLLRFQELQPDQVETLLQSAGNPVKARCRFLEVSIPRQWQSEDVTYEYRSTFSLRDDLHYVYWYAPNMMHIRKLIFDYSKFPDLDKWNFTVLPFLGNVAGDSVRGEHSFTVRPNDWIMPGHGFALVWEPVR